MGQLHRQKDIFLEEKLLSSNTLRETTTNHSSCLYHRITYKSILKHPESYFLNIVFLKH